jgi:hypothetical protein
MASMGRVTLEEVKKAFQQLGGQADWCDTFRRLDENRGSDYSHYSYFESYKKTAFQVIQRHCHGYEKFRGPVQFEKVGKERFRLV